MAQTWFVTDAGKGFGFQLTELLLSRGYRVAATVEQPEALAELADRYGEYLWIAALDMRKGTAVRRVIDRAFAELKYIDVVVSHPAGMPAPDDDTPHPASTEREDTHALLASLRVARASLTHLRRQGGGRIIQISSIGDLAQCSRFSIHAETNGAFAHGCFDGTLTDPGVAIVVGDSGVTRYAA